MLNRPMRILQVSASDSGGGAEKIAWDLFQYYRACGEVSWLAVGTKTGDDPGVIAIPRTGKPGFWNHFLSSSSATSAARPGNSRVVRMRAAALRMLADPGHELRCRFGLENFDYPGSRALLELTPARPDIVHCHNLHGGYFDLRFLSQLSKQVPVLLTLHDAWLLSGHCAHSFDCERWKTGCGRCPDLTIYPEINRDATSYNWRRKQKIFSNSVLCITTPSKWLMNKVEQSMLWSGVASARVIPNGVDLAVFHPGDKAAARTALGLPQDAAILLFTAHLARSNVFKDYSTLEKAIARVEITPDRRLILICLGTEAAIESLGAAEVRCFPFEKDPAVVAQYYQAADIYVHASHADTFPCSVLEALACATPVVATAVGGIPEQIKGLDAFRFGPVALNLDSIREATGVLVPPADPEAMAHGVQRLLRNPPILEQMAKNASEDARYRFSIEQQAERHLEWYAEVQEAFNARRTRPYFTTVMPQPVH
jgi:glycosyltransferase involved in cell wall biosynthesis